MLNDVAIHVEMIEVVKVQVGLSRVDKMKCRHKVKTAKNFYTFDVSNVISRAILLEGLRWTTK